MYDETNVPGPEIRIRPVVRHLVTVFYHPYTQSSPESVDGKGFHVPGSSKVLCECDNERQAEEVAHALQSLYDLRCQNMPGSPDAREQCTPRSSGASGNDRSYLLHWGFDNWRLRLRLSSRNG